MAQLKCPYTRNTVDGITDMLEAAELLDNNDIPYDDIESLEEMKHLLTKHLDNVAGAERVGELSSRVDSMEHNLFEKILEKYPEMVRELDAVYDDLIRFLTGSDLEEEIVDELEINFENFKKTINDYREELCNDECPIVVAGETSAGKSSLLNLLLGSNVLPTSLLSCTSAICRLRNSQEKKLQIYDSQEKVIETISLEDSETESSIQEKLGPYVIKESNKMVDLYWPIPLLKGNVIIVDTPGIGETEELTGILLQYIPNAVAFIYVINTFHAGGVHSDRLGRIIRQQKDWKAKGKLQSFDPRSAIFVCNKWDLVPEGQEEKVWDDTLHRLQCWPGLTRENADKQVFKFSCTEASRYLCSGLGKTNMFKKLLAGIENLIPASLENKVKRHFDWLKNFLHRLQLSIAARINTAKKTEEEKKQRQTEVATRLRKLNQDSEKIGIEIIQKAKDGCHHISSELFTHLQEPSTCDKLLQLWKTEDFPTGSDMEVIKYNSGIKVREQICEETKNWLMEGRYIVDLSKELEDEFRSKLRILKQECDDIDMLIEGKALEAGLLMQHEYVRGEPPFTREEKIILGATAILWAPLVIVGALLALPVAIGVGVHQGIKEGKKVQQYYENRSAHLREWTQRILEKISEESVEKLITDGYLGVFIDRVNYICKESIPKLIRADEMLINHIANDRRCSTEILLKFNPLQNRAKRVHGSLVLFGLQFFQHSHENNILDHLGQNRTKIGGGTFADVYVVDVINFDNITKAAIKVLRRTSTKVDVVLQMPEIDCLRNLNHENVVRLYGVIYQPASQEKIQIVMEYCEFSLETYIFDQPKHICARHHAGTEGYTVALTVYFKMATQICNGLHFIHQQMYIHRDLKLSNVLVKDMGNKITAKICDMGLSKEEKMLTGTYCGTVSHMAPEVLDKRPYSRSADIYSLSILLWELWYGKHAYEDLESTDIHQVGEYIISGYRPDFKTPFAPSLGLQELISRCWDQKVANRPDAAQVKSTLHDIVRHIRTSHGSNVEAAPSNQL